MRTGFTNQEGPKYCSVYLSREHSLRETSLYIISSRVTSNAATFVYRKPDTALMEEFKVTEASKELDTV